MMIIRQIIQGYVRSTYSRHTLWITFLFSLFSIGSLTAQQNTLSQHDGPYILYTSEQRNLISVTAGQLEMQQESAPTFEVVSEKGDHRFHVTLHPIETPKATYKHNSDILVLSDPHGDFDSFHSILKAHRVIGEQYQWTFGNKHLVVIGDIFDRGEDVLPLFWLLYKLEAEAAQAGGTVHFLLGNHEEMTLRGNLKYAKEKYTTLAQQLGINYQELWGMESELGRWLLSRNTIEKIGDHLFVHAGLSADIIGDVWTINAINDSTRAHVHQSKEEREHSPAARFLFGSNGPLWYRGMVRTDEKYNPLASSDLEKILKQYDVKHIFVGHTIFPEVTTFYNGKVYGVNVANRSNREKGTSRGLLIKGNKRYLIYDNPEKKDRI
ncbi:metallophosphoesterase [Sphingobacterium faecale]|uniref:Metallophosphoesterase n=1 Tax=Sphingobacterium faecale TaxID=2803775 RepID=A0ABS1R7V0_9SPHI|nr:metallophosphoesterase [Sphingobacterium faecale]MBL1410304.1 metallophosphoesterase [Sphingobacterium faecale]